MMSIQDRLLLDLAAFADPATEVHTQVSQGQLEFRLERSGVEVAGQINLSTPDLEVKLRGGSRKSWRSLLASHAFADLDSLTRIQQRLYATVDGSSGIEGPTQIDGERAGPGVSELEQMLRNGPPDRTRLIVVDGPAGIGKSETLRRLAAKEAAKHLRREPALPLIIVSSTGRRLSRLNDAIAASLQDLRSKIGYFELPTLVRNGLVGLVIDGFDELASSEGYRDAWSSLSEMLDELHGRGLVIIAARDTFFDGQGFIGQIHVSQAARSIAFDIRFARLLPWREAQVRELATSAGADPIREDEIVRLLTSTGAASLARPYFVRALAEVSQESFIPAGSYLAVIVDSFIEREAGLLFRGEEVVPGRELLAKFFQELAGEMFLQEMRAVDRDVISIYLELALEAGPFTQERAKQILHKLGSVAFLEKVPGGRKDTRRFPHEILFDHFLARKLLDCFLGDPVEFERLLRASTLTLDHADAIVSCLEMERYSQLAMNVNDLVERVRQAVGTEPLHSNLGTFLFALLRRHFTVAGDVIIEGLHFGAVSLQDAWIPNVTFRACSFEFLDASSAVIMSSDLSASSILRLRVDEYTLLNEDRIGVVGCLEEFGTEGLVEIRDPLKIGQRLRELHLGDEPSSPSNRAGALLEHLARRWTRRFYFDPQDLDDEPSFGDPVWPQLRRVLEEHGRITEKIPDASGPRRTLLRLRDPKAILHRRHVDPTQQRELDSLWAAVARLP